MNKHNKGFFISVEGNEGAGKSTTIKFMDTYLKRMHIDAVFTREPGGTEIAEKIRKVLLDHHEETMAPETEALLMFASRAQHVFQKIIPALNEGKWVISDRFSDASIAYQGAGRNLGLDKIIQLKEWVLDSFEPNITILLDVPVEIGMERVKRRRKLDRIEVEKIDFFERIRAAYLELAKQNPDRYRVIDSSAPIASVKKNIQIVLDECLK